MSTARYGIMKMPKTEHLPDEDDPQIRCSLCNNTIGHYDHQTWLCSHNPSPMDPPTDPLQRRLGWAATGSSKDYNEKILQHMAATRTKLLATRYD